MQIAFVGLGKMGANMVRRLIRGGHEVVGYDMNAATVSELQNEDMIAADGLAGLVKALNRPRVVWMMVPAGKIVDETIASLIPLLDAEDILIDGGNSRYTDTIERELKLRSKNIYYLDAGTSGGVWGLKVGYCLMVGGDKKAVDIVSPVFKTLAPENGFLHVGPSGAGHYAKMIHNGIEYGIMQAYAEGFDLLESSRFEFDLPSISQLWNQGSVIRSWLLELIAAALKEDPKLEELKGYVSDSGEGRWTVQESIDLAVPAPVITASLQARFRSRRENTFSDRLLAAMRNQFGGHAVKK
ncbi:MAG: decarboxylating 6-phosphogluconate dehydrogenase [Deltaproteobacteria bacterium]|nr:decarboxylating 6-phosphogluconate dehydrogenase [Deltaproteobacteria bacterium]